MLLGDREPSTYARSINVAVKASFGTEPNPTSVWHTAGVSSGLAPVLADVVRMLRLLAPLEEDDDEGADPGQGDDRPGNVADRLQCFLPIEVVPQGLAHRVGLVREHGLPLQDALLE